VGGAHEWLHVTVASTLYAALFAWMGSNNQSGDVPSLLLKMRILVCVLGGLGCGILDAFGSRAWRFPLAFLSVGILVSMVVSVLIMRRVRRNGLGVVTPPTF
jgi:hypothetical protein